MTTVVARGVDYSGRTKDPAGIYAAGYRFVVRYVSPNTTAHPSKRITATEVDALHAAGLAVCLVWETTATEWTGSGETDYLAARRYASSIGFPLSKPIYMAVDSNVNSSQIKGLVARYFRGAITAAGGPTYGPQYVGIYGGRPVIEWAHTTYPRMPRWQTAAWSGGIWAPGITVAQTHNGQTVAGQQVDLNEAYTTDYGQWEPAMTAPTDIAHAVWDADYIPSGDPANPTWVAKNYLHWYKDQLTGIATNVAAIEADVTTIRATVSDIPPLPSAADIAAEIIKQFANRG